MKTYSLSLGVLSLCVAGSAWAASTATSRDIGYFTDAGDLSEGHEGLYGSVPAALQGKLPEYKKAFCARNENDIALSALEPPNALAFVNPWGWFHTGLCWWHSRFTRSALYLANFRPDLPRPSPAAATLIVHELIQMDHVVEVPGYANLRDFSAAYQAQITDSLSKWQVLSALSVAPLFQALSGASKEPTEQLRTDLETLSDRMIQQHAILFLQLVHPGGMPTHSVLVTHIIPVREPTEKNPFRVTGYALLAIDPNLPQVPFSIVYRNGDVTLHEPADIARYTQEGDDVGIQTAYDGDLADFQDALRAYCSP